MKKLRLLFVLVLVAVTLVVLVGWLNVRGEGPLPATPTDVPLTQERVERGAYLARAGNCASCHTERGGAPYAGGKAVPTPFGTVFAGNLTPDPATGLGQWSADAFWRAMHHGRSRDGRLLYPAFPYPEYTQVTREDSDALYAYLRTVPPVVQANKPHELHFPVDRQWALAVWRALFFSPGTFTPDPARTDDWNRGAYLVRGLGHCQACHAPRNALGATRDGDLLGGGLIPLQGWYAPSLASPAEAGVQDWQQEEVVALLRDGHTRHGAAMGPMAQVVSGSTQHLGADDLRAMATYLQDLPRRAAPAAAPAPAATDVLARGAQLYRARCAECHGERGEGRGPAYPPLAGHRGVTLDTGANLVKVILHGGFPATTAGHPRPYGMPPFGHVLNDEEIAALASFVRQSWGNQAPAVSTLDVQRSR